MHGQPSQEPNSDLHRYSLLHHRRWTTLPTMQGTTNSQGIAKNSPNDAIDPLTHGGSVHAPISRHRVKQSPCVSLMSELVRVKRAGSGESGGFEEAAAALDLD